MTQVLLELGTLTYREAERLQVDMAARLNRDEVGLLFCEVEPVYTRGTRTGEHPALKLPVIDVVRGGDITYHGPGQLLCYIVAPWGPQFTRRVELAVTGVLAGEGVQCRTREEYPGVWVEDRKIASLGFRVEEGRVTGGGVAVNVDMDLTPFEAIRACGIEDVKVTSLAAETGRQHPNFRQRLVRRMQEAFG